MGKSKWLKIPCSTAGG